NSSLYQTLVNAGASGMLSSDMADLFAWTIDFYRLQKGDKFKVIYFEQFVEGKSVGIDHIESALFEHAKKEIYAIPFVQNDIPEFFDLKANGLRRTFLKAPLKFSRISSRYSGRRFHPVQKRYKAHLGTDYAAPKGTPIMATADGVITDARYKKYNGNYVKVKHNGTYTTQYLHMTKIKTGIKPGVRVRQGDIIGFVGSTGLATGPHVCYRFWKNGKQVDPYKQKLPPSNPVSKDNMPAFEKIRDSIKSELDAIPYEELS
ncbi:MAG: peptidoglycan DD-metalloendopeptidase family protein, partial [Flavobacteriales bacterium]|nr:peptidoglycan DD-metalloendopeptidase family protein [Flavobacteriales bacterium]